MMNAVCSPWNASLLTMMPATAKTSRLSATSPQETNGGMRREKGGRQEGDHGQPRRARHQRRQQDGQQAGAAILDDAGAEHGRHVAAEAEEQRHERLAVQPHQVHEAIHDVRAARQIADVFQRRPARRRR